jgi:hypothetical protein
MKPKSTKESAEQQIKYVVPTHKQIEENIGRELQLWQQFDRNGPYPLPVLDFIIGHIGVEIHTCEDNEDIGKDTEYYNPSAFVNGITNGELFYSLYITLTKMTEEEKFDLFSLPICDQQAFASMLDLATTLFLEQMEDTELDQTAVDLWILYSWCQRMKNKPLWIRDDGEATEPPELNKLTREDWELIAEEVKEHFIDYDIELQEMALLDEQPHWPTFQEFRKAKTQLLDWSRRTRWNRKAN